MKLKEALNQKFEIVAIVVSLLLLGISSCFSWDSNPIMGLDKLCADCIIVIICVLVIRYLGLWDTFGFQAKGFGKGIL